MEKGIRAGRRVFKVMSKSSATPAPNQPALACDSCSDLTAPAQFGLEDASESAITTVPVSAFIPSPHRWCC